MPIDTNTPISNVLYDGVAIPLCAATTYNTTFSTTASDYVASGTNYTLTKTLTGLNAYDAFLLETSDTFTNTYGGSVAITANAITFTINAIPTAEFSINYSIIKCIDGGAL